VAALLNFSEHEAESCLGASQGAWAKVIDSVDEEWDGPGSRLPGTVDAGPKARLALRLHSFALYERK
jgi:hypothetical protein